MSGEMNGSEVELNGNVKRSWPLTHPPVDAPLCENCQQLDLEFFDPSCPGCGEILNHPQTTIAQIFACLRQWVPQTQRNIEGLVQQVLDRGANVNDRDGLTDMTLLHFACKAGASGVGDPQAATRTVQLLLSLGAEVNSRCKWTQMTALHYSSYFDAASIVQLLLQSAAKHIDINATCVEYNKGTALHIAAGNLCLETARVLIQYGARLNIKDSLGRWPIDCIPNDDEFVSLPHVRDIVKELKLLFTSASSSSGDRCSPNRPLSSSSALSLEPVSGRALLRSMGLSYGSRVLVNRAKAGYLRFCGTTEFAMGLWVGVELDEPEGKNDGSVNGVVYFRCAPSRGIFVPVNKISKYMSPGSGTPSPSPSPTRRITTPLNKPYRIDFSKVTSKIECGLSNAMRSLVIGQSAIEQIFELGERVLVNKKKKGTVRYFGLTRFALGDWYGVELDLANGKNDGCVDGHRYFICQPKHGIFAQATKLNRLLTSSAEQLTASTCLPVEKNFLKRSPLRMSLRISQPTRSPRHLSTNIMTNSWSPTSLSVSPNTGAPNIGPRLATGVKVLVHNQLGVIRYVGEVDFTEGTWVGVELSVPEGRHDGAVKGRRYFQCKPGHGLLVRPNRVSIHGINGAQLLQQQDN
ncbi:CAP-Gly domain-containing linker protein 4 [Chamberlinius hualienensis]